ncbi:exonuclease SbcD [Polycladomyces abyssicola]|uniref:Exonuclease SbcD n=1 Tax=Polycladomyces abyssicola TaxID=1125966 RepID=A0A8D5UGF9_9BACL|nr:metallophosphoesterase [Polycladomyces abyssicola]BCU82011.1 exonuclease SbcD [Polycladomyces abyssicola]
MRLLYLTDTHIRGTSPRSRTDDFPTAMRRKLEEVIQLAHDRQVDAVLHGGDFFDRPDLSPAVVREFASLLRRLKVPLYTIAGNHDIYGHNPDTVDRSMLGLLDAFGVIRLLRPGETVKLERGGVTVQLSGQPFHHELDKRDPGLDYAVSNVTGADFCVHMVHGMAVDRHLPEGVPHTLLDHLWFDSVDVLLTGHYHAGFPVQRREGRYIVNPGALARINNHPSEMRRQPQVALLTFAESVQVELIALQCAAKGTDVLDRSYLEQAAYREEKLAAFVRQVRATGEFQGIDAIDIIEEIARLEGIEPDVKYEAMRRIAIVQERLGTEGGRER